MVQLLDIRTAILLIIIFVPLIVWRCMRHIFLPEPFVWGIAIISLILLDFFIRLSPCQAALWLASRARLHPDQSFMREVCYIRLEENTRNRTPEPSVILVGSSQMLNGIDSLLLHEKIAPTPVIRRAMFGMTPLKALAMMPYMPFQSGDTCVQYLSEFDFSNQEEFPVAWFRPYASWQTLPQVVRCIGLSATLRNSGRLIDYVMAANWEGWRARDFLHQIIFNMWGASPIFSTVMDEKEETLRILMQRQTDIIFMSAEKSAFERFRAVLKSKDVRMVVLEGDVNPLLYTPSRKAAKASTREWLSSVDQPPAYWYISAKEQHVPFDPSLWKDMTHLNVEGRALLTQILAGKLQSMP